MIVQGRTVTDDEDPVKLIEIPDRIPNDVIENESILFLESKLRKLENKIVVAAQSILNLITEQKTRTSEIERLKNYYEGMSELIVSQKDRIDDLEKKDGLTATKLYDIIDYIDRKEIQTSAKLDTIIENIDKKEDEISVKLDNLIENAEKKTLQNTVKLENTPKQIETNKTKIKEKPEIMEKVEDIINDVEKIETQTHNKLESITEKLERNENQKPDELLQIGYDSIKTKMRQELVDKLKHGDFQFFEKIILQLLTNMGYGNGEVINRNTDDRIDGFIKPDKLGFDRIYFRAHKFKNNTTITMPMISDFVGTLELNGANKGIFITTSNFEQNFEQVLKNINKIIILIDGNKLGELMMEYNIGVKTEKFFEIKMVDSDFFTNES